MSFSVITSVNHLISEYRRFLLSTYRLADKKLRDQFEEHIRQADVLVKGPYVTLANEFARQYTLKQLCHQGCCHKDLQRLNWSFGDNELYLHQENSLRRVEGMGRNCIVKTGTGSGKTESFLLPILSGVLKLRADGVIGTKAILLYPMNALANDQLVRLRALIRNSGVGITFAMYTGESENVAMTLGEPVKGNEFIRREEIQNNQPDILLRNYKQLEFMLLRKEDRPLFSPSLTFLVLDEIHSYRGALATEMACLIRRLKARAGLGEGRLRCIGTSATISKDAGGDKALAEFVSSLFGESFSHEDIIGETIMPKPLPSHTYTPPLVRLKPDEIQNLGHEDDAGLTALVEKITGQKLDASGSIPQKIRATLKGNELVAVLEQECREPRSLAELAGVLKACFQGGNVPSEQKLTEQEWRTLTEAYLLVGSTGTDRDPPNLRPKLHTFRKPRTLTYNSPKRKGIKRQVVKERKGQKKTYFENEGFGFEVVTIDDRWAIRIKPFYMFTERDAKTPLPSFARAAYATRRIKFDRNKSVEDDLTFWARFLSGGSPTINIGQDHVEGLLLQGKFLTYELPVN